MKTSSGIGIVVAWAVLFEIVAGFAVAAPPVKKEKPAASKATLKAAKSKWQKFQLPETRALTVGDKGTFSQLRHPKILQVIDPNNAIVELRLGQLDASGRMNVHTFEEVVWVVVHTAGLVDGQFVQTGQVFEATGTKTYKTGVGSNTVVILEIPDEAKDEADGYHTFLTEGTGDGGRLLVGKVAALKGGKLTLEKKDGSTTEVPLRGVSTADQKYAQKVIASHAPRRQLPSNEIKGAPAAAVDSGKEKESDKSNSDSSNGPSPEEGKENSAEQPAEGKAVYLSDLKETSKEFWEYIPGFGFGTNGTFFVGDGKYAKIVLDGKESPKGIFAHPKSNGVSKVTYNLKGQNYKRFTATIGVADERKYGPNTSLTFEVWGDGKLLWKSEPVKQWGQSQQCDVKLPKLSQLQLRVKCPGDAGFAYAVWCEPRLIE